MPSLPLSPRRAVIGAVLTALLTGLVLVAPTPTAPASAASSASSSASSAAASGKVRGNIFGQTGGKPLRLKMLFFKGDWTYLGSRKLDGGAYSITLPAGSYHLQFIDLRPSYDVKKFAPTDVAVKVSGGRTTVKNVRMRPGAAITGTVRANGKPAAKARIVAANPSEQSFETTANDKGQFAIGGLPAGAYSVFTYDRTKTWVGKSAYIPKLKRGQFGSVNVNLNRRAGGLLVDLYADGQPLKGTGYATAVSRASGQFWTAKIRQGSVTFQGLFPGRYKIVVPDVGRWIGRTGAVKNGVVRGGRTAFGSFALTQQGGQFTGKLVREDGTSAMGGATVRLYDKSGALVAETKSASTTGVFRVGGSLRTQSGMTLVAFNAFDDTYKQITKPGLSIAINQTKSLGVLQFEKLV